MESEFCISKEHPRKPERDRDCYLPEVVYKEYKEEDFPKVCMLYWEFYLTVLKKDLSRELTLDDGLKILEVETHVNKYLSKGCDIVLAYAHDEPIGMLIFHRVYPELACAWVGYVKPEYENRRVGIGIIKSLRPVPSKFIFQTLNANPSDRMLQITEGARTLLHHEPIHSVWMVDLKDYNHGKFRSSL
jgi:hypothetical protein